MAPPFRKGGAIMASHNQGYTLCMPLLLRLPYKITPQKL